MKIACYLFLPLMALNAGCLETPLVRRTTKTEPSPQVVEQKPALPQPRSQPPVTADQITEANAHAKAKELEDELSRDEQDHVQANMPVPREVHKP
jgi:hypothetical protein